MCKQMITGLFKAKVTYKLFAYKSYIYIYIYIYILQQYMTITNSLGRFVADQIRYNLESAQYLW